MKKNINQNLSAHWLILALLFTAGFHQPGSDYEIESIVIHPPFENLFFSGEHPAGSEEHLGDRLGRDFSVMSFSEGDRRLPEAYKGDGMSNEDWFSWREPVLAPVEGVVEEMHINETTNRPGEIGEPPASSITIRTEDGTRVRIAHVREIVVEEGDRISRGEFIARVGNNGISFAPHIHIGAWKDETPLQIQVDLKRLGELQGQMVD